MLLTTFEPPLIEARLIKRYKRFFVDAERPDGSIVTAHCANTGSMLGLLDDTFTVWLSPANDPNRKLQYTLELVDTGDSMVGVHTGRPNKLVEAAILGGAIPELPAELPLKREQKYGQNSRIDLLQTAPDGRQTFIEVKNVTLRQGDAALFPDAVTTRGTKHLHELTEQVAAGHRAVMFYLVQRQDCQYFAPARHIDKDYAATLDAALAAGVEAIAYSCKLSPTGIELGQKLEIRC